MLCAGCYRISIVLAFLCGLKKTIRIRYEWTRIFSTTEGKNSPSSKTSGYVYKGPKIVKISCLFLVVLLGPFKDHDRFPYPFIYFNYAFIRLKPEKGTPFDWSLLVL